MPSIKWIAHVDSPWPSETAGADDFHASGHAFIDSFEQIEDVRFKVKHAHFRRVASIHADASVYISIVGRDGDGKRTWIEAKVQVEAVLDDFRCAPNWGSIPS